MTAFSGSIEAAFLRRTPGSAALAREAAKTLPGGITHDSRHLSPYSIYVERADGATKWDVDGNRYIDYFGGHGSLILGHNHSRVVAALRDALARGTHFAANHEGEVAWARLVVEMVPSAERVRFTSSGTEAVAMAVRLARAHTGRNRIVRFRGHFHGWADDAVTGYASHFNGSAPAGIPGEVASNVVLLETSDPAAVRATLRDQPDIAAVLIEPLGAATGMVPVSDAFLQLLREETSRHGQLLIFDEVITGFRVSEGGVQKASGVTPDLSVLAKILAGGLPGGAVAGREDILAWLDYAASGRLGREKIYHPGTYNANPLSAAAGAAALSVIAAGGVCTAAAEKAERLRQGFKDVLAVAGVRWGVYGRSSVIHICMNPDLEIDPAGFVPDGLSRQQLQTKPPGLLRKLRLAMLVNGIDLSGWPGGLVSLAHTDEDLQATTEALRESLAMIKREGPA